MARPRRNMTAPTKISTSSAAAFPSGNLQKLNVVTSEQPSDETAAKDQFKNDRFLLEVKTVKSVVIKVLFESLKYVLTEANLIFSDNGLRMSAVDSKKYALVHLSIDSSSFEYYHCVQRLVLGVDIGALYKLIKTINVSDTLSFFVDREAPGYLGISMENTEKQTLIRYNLPLMQLPEYKITDEIEFEPPPPEVSSTDFQKYIRDMAALGAEYVDIQCVGDQLILRTKDGIAKHEVIMNISSQESVPSTMVVQGTFMLKFLQSFSKAAHLSPKMRICLKNDNPLICEYDISSLGKLKYVLSQMTPA